MLYLLAREPKAALSSQDPEDDPDRTKWFEHCKFMRRVPEAEAKGVVAAWLLHQI